MTNNGYFEENYKRLCKQFNGRIFYWDSQIYIFRVIYTKFDIKLSRSRLTVNIFKRVCKSLGLDWKDLELYIVNNKQFYSEPVFVIKHFIFDNGVLRPGLKTIDDMDRAHTEWNLETGEIFHYPGFAKSIKDNSEDIEKLFNMILPKKIDRYLVRNFFAQVAFENRANKGRATLILTGARGAGKGLLMEMFANRLAPRQSIPLPIDKRNFDGYKTYKLVYADESEDSSDIVYLEKIAKELSGQSYVTINRKYEKPYKTEVYAHLIITSNHKPIHLTSQADTAFNNQWIVVNFTKALENNNDFLALREKYNHNFSTLFEESFLFWIKKYLLPVFVKLQEKQEGRYGFRIPVSESLLNLYDLSTTEYEINTFNLLEILESKDLTGFPREIQFAPDKKLLIKSLERFQSQKFLSNNLFKYLSTSLSLNLTLNQFRTVLKRYGIFDKSKSVKLDNSSARGTQILPGKYQEVMDPANDVIDDIAEMKDFLDQFDLEEEGNENFLTQISGTIN